VGERGRGWLRGIGRRLGAEGRVHDRLGGDGVEGGSWWWRLLGSSGTEEGGGEQLVAVAKYSNVEDCAACGEREGNKPPVRIF
jgi:hypothetical protein